jgi:hypothetical protein
VLVVAVGLVVGWRRGGRTIVLLGSTNAVVGASILIGNLASDFRVPALVGCAVFLLGVLATTSRDSWRAARLEVILGGATIVGIWSLSLLPSAMAPPVRTALLAIVVAFAAAFVGVTAVRGFRIAAQIRQ